MTYHCRQCTADLLDESVVEGADIWAGVPVHLHDSGPRHDQVEVHPVHDGVEFGALYVHPTERPGYAPPVPGNLFNSGTHRATLAPDPAGWLIGTDVSQWQAAIYSQLYGRRWGAYRLSLSTTLIDTHGKANATGCSKAPQLIFHMGYHVWYPGNLAAQIARFLAAGVFTANATAMLDVESWSGAVSGDHSAELNQAATMLADHLGASRVKRYGNAGDLASIWPHPPAWLGNGVARYDDDPPTLVHDWWQYTDGSPTYPTPAGFPTTSVPFGPCDHNAIRGTAAQVASIFGVTKPAPPTPPKPVPTPSTEDDPMQFFTLDPKTVPAGQPLLAHAMTFSNEQGIQWINDGESLIAANGGVTPKAHPISWNEMLCRLASRYGPTGWCVLVKGTNLGGTLPNRPLDAIADFVQLPGDLVVTPPITPGVTA